MSNKPVAAGKSSFDLIDPSVFFSRVKIPAAARVLDLACGIGNYSIAISPLLDERGLVYAVDLWDEGLEKLRHRIQEKGISNIRPVKADITKHIPLENGSVDFCLIATILHDLTPREQDSTLKEAARVIKADGVLALVEFKKISKGPGPPMRIRISETEAEEKMKKYGFIKTSEGDIGEFTYLMTFRKTG